MGRASTLSRKIAGDKPGPIQHAEDLHAWVEQQVAFLRAGRTNELDLSNIAEELSDVGAEQYDKLESALEVLLMHMLKWDFQPTRRSSSWALTIEEQRHRVTKQLRKNPSLKARTAEAVEDGFRLGRLRAARETRMSPATFLADCPYDWHAIMDREFRIGRDTEF